jgi:hypothetical protein
MCTFIPFVSLLRMHNFSIANYTTHSTVVIDLPVVMTTVQTCYISLHICSSQFHHKSPKQVAWPCHSQSTLSLTSHHGGTGSLVRKFTWDSWWAKRQCNRFYGAHHLSPQFPSHQCCISIHLSSAVMENAPITGCSFRRQSLTLPP